MAMANSHAGLAAEDSLPLFLFSWLRRTSGHPGTQSRRGASSSKRWRASAGCGKKVGKKARRTISLRGSMCGDSTVHEALLLPGGASMCPARRTPPVLHADFSSPPGDDVLRCNNPHGAGRLFRVNSIPAVD